MVRWDYPIKGNYKKWKIEWWFQKELFSFLEKDGYICYHIPDTTYEYRLLDGICVSPTWDIFFLELKKIELYTFNMSQFEWSQIAFMQALQKRWVESYIGVYSQKTNEYIILTYSSLCEMINDKWWVKLFNK
jgi:hypothetical protein